jgi:hypothetical protein
VRPSPRRYDEAVSWFAEARHVLAEQEAAPLLAITDHDEALMYRRRAGPGDDDRAAQLFAVARPQFVEIGMTGWVRQVDRRQGG